MRTEKELKGLFDGVPASGTPTTTSPAPTSAYATPGTLYYVKAYPLSPWCGAGWWEDEAGTKVSSYCPSFEHASAWRLTQFSHEAGK